MRLPLPPVRVRRLVVRRLHDFHDDPDEHDDALEDAAHFYEVGHRINPRLVGRD